MRLRPSIDDVPPQAFFVGSAIFHYLGPAFAVLLFARVDILGVAWLRVASAALIFACWRRPWRTLREANAAGLRLLVAWGAVLATMNVCFYEAIARLPLATVAAIEFVPVIVLAAAGARTGRNACALALAVLGVWFLTDVPIADQALGFALAFCNAGLFALYVVLGDRVAKRESGGGIDGLASAMLVAALLVTPVGAPSAARALGDPITIAAGVGVGITSSVIPYVCDQLALARIARASYALLVSLLPATAALIGIVVLTQIPAWTEALGIALVIAGVAWHRPAPALVSAG